MTLKDLVNFVSNPISNIQQGITNWATNNPQQARNITNIPAQINTFRQQAPIQLNKIGQNAVNFAYPTQVPQFNLPGPLKPISDIQNKLSDAGRTFMRNQLSNIVTRSTTGTPEQNQYYKDIMNLSDPQARQRAINSPEALNIGLFLGGIKPVESPNLKFLLKEKPGYSNVPMYDNPLLLGRDWQTKIKNPIEAYTKIPTDEQTIQRAYIRGGATGQPDNEVIQVFKDWVNSRRASKVEGMIKGGEFSDLDAKGLKGIYEFQSGATTQKGLNMQNTQRYQDVKNYFDEMYASLQRKGIDFNYKQDYLPQLWNNTKQEVEQVFGRKLGIRPSFTMQSLFRDYQTGIDAGLTPKFTKISDLVGWYESRAQNALANKSFFDFLGRNGIIQPTTYAPKDWVTISPDRFPQYKVKIDKGFYAGHFKAPEELAGMINNYLNEPSFTKLQQVANFASQSKNRLLSFGVPNTGLNFHGFNILARSYMEGGPLGALKTAEYMINPSAAQRYIDANLKMAPDAIKSGLSFSTSERAASMETETFLKGFGKKWNDLFEKPLFDKLIGAKKLEGWDRVWKSYAKNMPEAEAKREASKFINTIYGGINLDQIGRSKDLQNFMRVALLTPDWLESNIRLGANIVKSAFQPTNPTGQAYRRVLTNLIAGYVGLNIVNKLTSGHYMIENDPGHTFELEIGYTADGQKRYYRPFGTAADFVRLPVDIAVSLAKGDPSTLFKTLRNRLSTVLQPGISLLTNTNWAGQAIYGKDKYGKPLTPVQSATGILNELGTVAGFPAFAQQGLNYLTGRQGLEQSLLQMVELPVRYSGGAYTKTEKEMANVSGLKGKELYDFNKKVGSEAPLGKNQLELFKQQGIDYLNSLYKKREETAHDKIVKEQVKQTNQPVQEGNKYYFVDVKGNPKVVDLTTLNANLPTPTLTGNTEVDKKLISQFNSELSQRGRDIFALFQAGKLTASEAEAMIASLQGIKMTTIKTPTVRKARVAKPKKISIKISKGKKISFKIKKPKSLASLAIKIKKAPKIKIAKRKKNIFAARPYFNLT